MNLLPEKTLQIISATTCFYTFVAAFSVSVVLSCYLLTTRLWVLFLLYMGWIYHDRKTSERGGRRVESALNWKMFHHMKNYYTAKLTVASGFSLDPKRNYLVGCFPHALLAMGPMNCLVSGSSDFHAMYPHFKVHLAILPCILLLPFMRELGLALGFISCSAESLNYVLSRPEGGHVVALFPGGGREVGYCRPGRYTFYVKDRKGFVKVALRNGASLIPAITFGDVDVFERVEWSKLRRLNEFLLKRFGFYATLFRGRGFSEDSVGLFPRRKALNCVLGVPIEVVRNENPSGEEIDELHAKFVEELGNLFERYKYEFLEDADNIHLVLE